MGLKNRATLFIIEATIALSAFAAAIAEYNDHNGSFDDE